MGKGSRPAAAVTASSSASPPKAGPTLDAQIRFAIANTRLIRVGYHGRLRVAEPHDYGQLNRTTKLLIYQRGDVQKTRATRWRLLDVSEITECAVLDEGFTGSRGESYQRHLAWEVLYARVR
jgi:hypothetical protein